MRIRHSQLPFLRTLLAFSVLAIASCCAIPCEVTILVDGAGAPVQLIDWDDGAGLRIARPGVVAPGRYTALYGGDFSPTPLWSDLDHKSFGFNHVVGDDGDYPWPDCEDFVSAELLEGVTDREGSPATVLRMQIKKYPVSETSDSGYHYLNQLNLVEAQPGPGRPGETVTTASGSHVLGEPIFYQSEWVKFSPDTLERAQAVQASGKKFWQMFWELKAPGYRIIAQILMNEHGDGFIVRAKADSMGEDAEGEGDVPYFTSSSSVPVELGLLDEAKGWNHFEVFMDRTRGRRSRFIVHMNGKEVCNLTQPLPLPRVSPPISTVFYANVYSNTNILEEASMHAHYILIDDLELWTAPPCISEP